MADLKKKYEQEIKPALKDELGLSNIMEVPRLQQNRATMGVGEAVADRKQLDAAVENLEAIAGQKAIVTNARKSIAGFKIRDGFPVGCKVTLRRERMYEFFDRLINIAIPRQRISGESTLDPLMGHGNFAMGIAEQIVFPEIDYDKIDRIRGLDIDIVTTAVTDDQSRALLHAFNFPLRESS